MLRCMQALQADALLSERAVDSNGLTPIEGTLPGDFLERQVRECFVSCACFEYLIGSPYS